LIRVGHLSAVGNAVDLDQRRETNTANLHADA
jgi:hypothetical protein